jgi:hypothetical protein
MANSPIDAPLLLWLTPSLLALLLYGLGQGFVKMWITEVPPARFCLYFACARAVVMGFYFLANPHTPVFAAEGRHVLAIAALVLRKRIMLLQWICIAAILVGMFFCSS